MRLYTIATTAIAAAAGACIAAAVQERRISAAHHDPSFGILTRHGVECRLNQLRGPLDLLFVDIDHMHDLNAQLGYAEVNRRLRAALQIRRSDALLVGRWYSGDEIVLATPAGDGAALAGRLLARLQGVGLSATIGVELAACYRSAISVAAQRVQLAKASDQRGRVLLNA